MANLLRVKLVGRQWSTVIADSLVLQQNLFSRPRKARTCWRHVHGGPANDHTLTRLRGSLAEHAAEPDTTYFDSCTPNPLLFKPGSDKPNFDKIELEMGSLFSFDAPATKFNSPPSMIAKMQITEPPATRLWVNWSAGRFFTARSYALTNPEDVTVRDLLDSAREYEAYAGREIDWERSCVAVPASVPTEFVGIAYYRLGRMVSRDGYKWEEGEAEDCRSD